MVSSGPDNVLIVEINFFIVISRSCTLTQFFIIPPQSTHYNNNNNNNDNSSNMAITRLIVPKFGKYDFYISDLFDIVVIGSS